jgi:serine/threonine-protein phosphatase 2A activator
MALPQTAPHSLEVLDPRVPHEFVVPVKRIHDGDDVSFFLASKAYADIVTFIFQLNASMVPRKTQNEDRTSQAHKEWRLQDSGVSFPPVVQNLASLLQTLGRMIEEAPPDPGPRRFGNISFRKWYDLVKERISGLLDEHLPPHVLAFGATTNISAKAELEAYLVGSFGSSQRLDYGTGHELSFLAFLGCLWKLGAFPNSEDGSQERAIVLGVIEPYVQYSFFEIITLTTSQLFTAHPAIDFGLYARTCRLSRGLGLG